MTVLNSKLCSAENMVERYCRRRFTPLPAFQDPEEGYQRRLVTINSSQSAIVTAAGVFPLTFGGHTAEIYTSDTPAEIQAELNAAWATPLDGGSVVVTGGPLPAYGFSITFAGSSTGEQPAFTTDPGALPGFGISITDCGFDSNPPVLKNYSTRGEMTVRVQDLRVVDPAADPRSPGLGGISLRGQRLQTNQYDLGYAGYADGSNTGIGDSYAEPVTHIELIPFYAPALAFSTVLGYGPWMSNDLQIVGRWGWVEPPADILDAVYAASARLYNERNASFSDQMINNEGVVFQFFKQMPASVQATLDSYRIPNFALI
jgi:hypothetical protein